MEQADKRVEQNAGGPATRRRERCVIRASLAEIVAFADIGDEFAAAEGEGDGSLAYWREAHRAAFGSRAHARRSRNGGHRAGEDQLRQ